MTDDAYARAERRARNVEDARRLRASLARDPTQCAEWIQLGYACTLLVEYDEAERAFGHALETAHGDQYLLGWLYRYRGHLWNARGDYRRAIADYEAAGDQGDAYLYGGGDAEECFLFAADLYEKLGDRRRAISCLESFLMYRPNAPAIEAELERLRSSG